MIWADVAAVAGLGLASLLERVFMPQVTGRAVSHTAVGVRRADLVAADASQLCDRISFNMEQGVSGGTDEPRGQLAASRVVADLLDRVEHLFLRRRQRLESDECGPRRKSMPRAVVLLDLVRMTSLACSGGK